MNGPASAQAATMGGLVVKESGHHVGGAKILAGETEGSDAARDEGTLFFSSPPNLAILHEDDPAKAADVSQPGCVLNVLVFGIP
jgi:hypothetical protein